MSKKTASQKNVLVRNKLRSNIAPLTIGSDYPTRVIVNIGVTPGFSKVSQEIEKATAALKAGAHVVADHTITSPKEISVFLKMLVELGDVTVSTVPYYATAVKALKEKGAIVNLSHHDLLAVIEDQCRIGVDIMTIHASLNQEILNKMQDSKRIIKMTSRAGTWIAGYMTAQQRENPQYEYFDEILAILKKYNVTLSLGPSLRTGSIADPIDELIDLEIMVQSQLVERAIDLGVQVIVEYGGHICLDKIAEFMRSVKTRCFNVPLRPLILASDVAVGWDHISAAIAGAIAASNGADVLTTITRAEHLGLPRIEDIVEGVIAARISGHIADTVKHNDLGVDRKMAQFRESRDWAGMWTCALDSESAQSLFKSLQRGSEESDHCSMCGELCAHKILENYLLDKNAAKSAQ